MAKQPKFKKIYILIGVAILLIGVYVAFPKNLLNDYRRMAEEEYTVAYLSMFPIDNYDEEDFTHYFAWDALKASYCIPNESILRFYMNQIASSGNTISTVFIGVRPDKISADELISLLREYPSVNYNILLPYPSMEYWDKLSDEKLQSTLQSYRTLTDALLLENNVKVYSFNKEWVLCNPANYEDAFLTNEDVSRSLFLTWTLNDNQGYHITADNIDTVFAELSELLMQNRTSPTVYPDLSDYKIVFFGDSVIGNYTDSASIPGVVNGLTGATVYNCGYGGNSAAYLEGAPINLPGIADAFVNQTASPLPEDTQVHKGVTEYLNDTSETNKLCFVINYGLNDYFNGAPVSTEDPYDVISYSGALRTAVTSLQQAYPEAQIILMTPNYTTYFEYGNTIQSEVGGILTDYVNAAVAVGKDCNVTVLDNYTELGINAENNWLYLEDGCHPSATGRYLIGQRIALNIK